LGAAFFAAAFFAVAIVLVILPAPHYETKLLKWKQKS
jgi:hypothetical protein